MDRDPSNGRTHAPDLKEITANFDGLVRLMDERDRLYKERDEAQKLAVKDALAAQKELANQAYVASQKATDKAESVGIANDAKQNEWRGQLKDQTSTFPTRIEMDNKIDGIADKLDDFKKDFEKYKETQATEIRSLRESRSSGEGRHMMFANAGSGLATILSLLIALGSLITLVILKHN